MARRDMVVIGASAGGVEALQAVVAQLPSDLPAAVLVVLHVSPSATSVLPAILQRAGALPATHAVDGEEIRLGRIYVARPDFHLLVQRGRLRVVRGPRVNGHRPAVDPLFLTAARLGARVTGVVLSGTLDDGTRGIAAIGRAGGETIAQDPAEALYAAMPQSAIDHAGVTHVLPAAGIAAKIVQLAGTEVPPSGGDGGDEVNTIDDELNIDPVGSAAVDGPASGFTCPECAGALWDLKSSEAVQAFRCRVGHSYTADSLLAAQSERLEEAIWAGYRALEESAALSKRLAERSRARGMDAVAERYEARYQEAIGRAQTLRLVLERGQLVAAGGPIANDE